MIDLRDGIAPVPRKAIEEALSNKNKKSAEETLEKAGVENSPSLSCCLVFDFRTREGGCCA